MKLKGLFNFKINFRAFAAASNTNKIMKRKNNVQKNNKLFFSYSKKKRFFRFKKYNFKKRLRHPKFINSVIKFHNLKKVDKEWYSLYKKFNNKRFFPTWQKKKFDVFYKKIYNHWLKCLFFQRRFFYKKSKNFFFSKRFKKKYNITLSIEFLKSANKQYLYAKTRKTTIKKTSLAYRLFKLISKYYAFMDYANAKKKNKLTKPTIKFPDLLSEWTLHSRRYYEVLKRFNLYKVNLLKKNLKKFYVNKRKPNYFFLKNENYDLNFLKKNFLKKKFLSNKWIMTITGTNSNIYVNIANKSGNTKFCYSLRRAGFQTGGAAKRSSKVGIEKLGTFIGKFLRKNKKIFLKNSFNIVFKGFGWKYRYIIKQIKKFTKIIKINKIIERTSIAHNGCRLKKRKHKRRTFLKLFRTKRKLKFKYIKSIFNKYKKNPVQLHFFSKFVGRHSFFLEQKYFLRSKFLQISSTANKKFVNKLYLRKKSY